MKIATIIVRVLIGALLLLLAAAASLVVVADESSVANVADGNGIMADGVRRGMPFVD